MSQSYHVPDPIQGAIELPQWLINIKDEPVIRRMLFIRQLGLKAYMNFPGAIHTRYSHALGTMSLAGKMLDMLSKKMGNKGKHVIARNLQDNKNNIMAAGFLHDLAQPPFSHALDLVLKVFAGKTHEELCGDIIRSKIPSEIENWGITKGSVIQLIEPKTHGYPFLSQIINGPLDSDKLDYLLRDAYHVGLRYSFDLDHFLRSYTVLGEEDELKDCILGLDLTQQAIVTAELFLVIWKSMYDLVYFVEQSRISEKMLEKAFLLCKDESSVKNMFQIDQYAETNDENMSEELKKMGPDVVQFLAFEDPKRLYSAELELELNKKKYKMKAGFYAELENNPDELSDQLSSRLAEELKQEKYSLICDIVKSKAPREIYLASADAKKHEIQLRTKSDIVGALTAKNMLRVYARPTVLKNISKKYMKEVLKTLVEEERGDD
jgi:HD superfamily phosphohydrolase